MYYLKHLSSNRDKLKIKLPKQIDYSAPFVSSKCKL